MLPEQIFYYQNLPFSIGFSNVAKEPPHYHREMEMALVLRGTVCYKIHHQEYLLSAGDVLIVDTEDLHRIDHSSKDTLMLTLHINLEYFNDLYPNIDFMIFACEECDKESVTRHQLLQNKVSFLRHHLAELAVLTLSQETDSQLLLDKIHQFIFLMVNQFQGFFIEDNQFKTSLEEVNSLDLDRLYRIIKYIYVNYDQKITLDDLAELEHLSPYYISHMIKETSGLSFQNFLNYVRVEYAEKFLAENKLTLTQISEFCGFSSSSYFNKCFRNWHHLTPAQYRKQLTPCERTFHAPFDQKEALTLLAPYLNTYRQSREDEVRKHSSHHMFIPVRASRGGGEDFQGAFPLHVVVDSASDILRLGYYGDQLMELRPASIDILASTLQEVPGYKHILSDLEELGIDVEIRAKPPMLRNSSVSTVAEAFASIMENPKSAIRLFGNQCALFTADGLPTPYGTLYHIFSGLHGQITERREQYLIIDNSGAIQLLISQPNSDSHLNTHLHFHNLTGQAQVVEKLFTKKHSVSAALKALGNPGEIKSPLKEHIRHAVSGETGFACIDGQVDPRLDIKMEPGTLALLILTEG